MADGSIKSALNQCSGRLGSPPPELPNHDWIVEGFGGGVNVTTVTRDECPVGYLRSQVCPPSDVAQTWPLAVFMVPLSGSEKSTRTMS